MEIELKLLLIFSAIFGLAVGSFLNVCIYRIPKKVFFKNKRSYCPNCLSTIKWYDMFPLFSWVALGGKCRVCKTKISIRYPIVEVLNAVLWILSGYYFGLSVNALIFNVIFSALIVMTFIDLDTKEIPNGIVLLITIAGIILFFTMPQVIWWHRLVGSIVISVPLLLIAMLTGGGIGGGDIKLFFAIGLALGLRLTLVAGLLSIILGGLIGAILLITKVAKKGTELPLGPFIALATVVSVFWGEGLIQAYLNLFGF